MYGWGYYRRSDWFYDLMGFTEHHYEDAKAKMEVVEEDGRPMLRSKVTGKAYGCGKLELGECGPFPSLSFSAKSAPCSLAGLVARAGGCAAGRAARGRRGPALQRD